MQELARAMSDPRYKSGDKAYHEEIDRRIAASQNYISLIMCVKMPWAVLFFFQFYRLLVFLSGCSKASFYPLAGSVGGATIGSLGGPGPAAGGAAVGWGVGEGSKYMEENKHLTEKVNALSEGDVQKLVQCN